VSDPLLLTLYQNGVLFQGRFREFDDQSSTQLLRDILDGYFPTEIKATFPDGGAGSELIIFN
jgi:hypothetical protein